MIVLFHYEEQDANKSARHPVFTRRFQICLYSKKKMSVSLSECFLSYGNMQTDSRWK